MSAVISPDRIASSTDAVDLLTADHDKAKAMFKQYQELQKSGTPEEKFELAKLLCGELLIHMALEEALFYPPVRNAIEETDLVREGEEEHDEAKDIIRALGDIDPASPEFDEKMQKLCEGINHHVEEEEHEMFPKVRQSKLDLEKLGQQLKEAKNATRVNLGLPPEA